MPTDEIKTLIEQGNFAAIMRECFALLETRHEGVSGMAYKQNVSLRAYLQSLYDAQPKSIKSEPVKIAAMAAAAYEILIEDYTVDYIKALPSLQFLGFARKLEHMYEPYKASYTTLPIF